MSGAAALFLDAVLQLEAQGWFRGMLDAMLAAGGCEGRRTPAGTPPPPIGTRGAPPGELWPLGV